MRQKSFDPSFLIKTRNETGVLAINNVQAPENFVPTNSFADFQVIEQLKKNILKHGYSVPTPIQDQTIPLILSGKDVVGIANTGTGKTAAFLIPLINKAYQDKTQRVLIIAPTRELAVQIQDELNGLNFGINIISVLCIGGVGIYPQIEKLRRNPQFVIGTPGRLRDLEKTRKINFAYFNNIVLDEVDRMLDIGFVAEIKHIISCLPRARQSLFFSATVPPKVQEVMRALSSHPVTVSVKTTDDISGIKQEVVKINGQQKVDVLHRLLIKQEFSKVLVFGRTKYGMEKLSRDLYQRGIRAASIHGNKNQNQRQRALNDFKNNLVQVLLATDIASRGIDIDSVTHVINYDLPESYEDYIHRIGRTGRANKQGIALTFVE
jgi:superfamily II DNA/RNA helicase